MNVTKTIPSISGNILALPFRRTHTVSLSSAIKQYISTKYDQHPDMFQHDLETIDHLRAEAVTTLEPHVSGVKKLSAYAAQLVWIGGKFPIDVSCSNTGKRGDMRKEEVIRKVLIEILRDR